MDIFISYRRKTGRDLAALINGKLKEYGATTFFDTSSIHEDDENWFKTIKDEIDSSPNFLMILTPGYLDCRKDRTDYVREEVIYAKQKNKKILAIASDQYDEKDVDWENEVDEIKALKHQSYIEYKASNEEFEKVFFKTIFDSMVDNNGKKYSVGALVNNVYYSQRGLTEEGLSWIKDDHKVCRNLDWEILKHANLNNKNIRERKELNLFVYKAYDIDTYAQKYSLGITDSNKEQMECYIKNIYGVTYKEHISRANKVFGTNHFIVDEFSSEDYVDQISTFLRGCAPNGFDIIDLTLILKDLENPEKVLLKLTDYLNEDGGIIYIRDLDDDYVDAYPDKQKYVKQMCEILDKYDDYAGNRHIGKCIYTFLKKVGAKEVCMPNEIITTANKSAKYRTAMYNTYFSYLIPEMEDLAKITNHKNSRLIKEKLQWLEENHNEIESMFRSSEFYFRAGYIAGYGVF